MDRLPDNNRSGNFSAYRSTSEVFSLNETIGEDPLYLNGGDSPTTRLLTVSIDGEPEITNSNSQTGDNQVSLPLRQTSIQSFFTVHDKTSRRETPESPPALADARQAFPDNNARPIRSSIGKPPLRVENTPNQTDTSSQINYDSNYEHISGSVDVLNSPSGQIPDSISVNSVPSVSAGAPSSPIPTTQRLGDSGTSPRSLSMLLS